MCRWERCRPLFIYVFLIYINISKGEDVAILENHRRGKALNISKQPCTSPSGQKGTCTFKWDCIKNNGTKIGTCMDGFIVGTCCYHSKDISFYNHEFAETINHINTYELDPYSKPLKDSSNQHTLPFKHSTALPNAQKTTTEVPTTAVSPQLVTWSSVSPTKIVVPSLVSPWPINHFLIKIPATIPLYTTKNHIKHKLKQNMRKGNFTIFGDVVQNSSNATNTLLHESTTISVPIVQWMSTKTTNVVPIINTINRLPIQTVFRPAFHPLAVKPQLTTSKPIHYTESYNTSTAASQLPIPQHGKPMTTAQPKKKQQALDYRKDCGVRALTPRARIVGGMSAHFGKWPWQILVKEAAWLGLYHKNKCGGVLISSKYAITAGHCQPGFLSSLVVLLGEYDLAADLESLKPEMRRVKRMVVHRHYNPQNFDNDIAILELDPPVVFRPHISPICLPDKDEDLTGKMAYVTGWGKTVHGGAIPNLLQEVQVPIVSNSKCLEMFKVAGHIKAIKDNFLCAGYETGGKDSCEGDSGGPLMVQRNNSQWVLAGTVSHGIRCADPNLPGIYMRISSYRPWIDKIIGSK